MSQDHAGSPAKMTPDGEVVVFFDNFAFWEKVGVGGEEGVALVVLVNVGDDEFVDLRKAEFVELGSANNEDGPWEAEREFS